MGMTDRKRHTHRERDKEGHVDYGVISILFKIIAYNNAYNQQFHVFVVVFWFVLFSSSSFYSFWPTEITAIMFIIIDEIKRRFI